MKICNTILLAFFFYCNGIAQSVHSIKTEKDCLRFVKEKLNQTLFEFDSSFTRPFFTKHLSGTNHAYWGITDVNADNQPDIYIVGKTKANESYPENSIAAVYLSNKDGKYKMVDVITSNNTCCYIPKIICKKKLDKTILCVYLCSDHGIMDRDSVLLKGNMYPNYVKWVDSLTFMENKLINYYSNPSIVKFDSLEYSFSSGWFDTHFSVKVYENGKCYLKPNGNAFTEIKLDSNTFRLLKGFVCSMDFNSIRHDFSNGWTDQNYVRLSIYTNGKTHELKDYGLQSNFTLMSIYQLFFELKNDNINEL